MNNALSLLVSLSVLAFAAVLAAHGGDAVSFVDASPAVVASRA